MGGQGEGEGEGGMWFGFIRGGGARESEEGGVGARWCGDVGGGGVGGLRDAGCGVVAAVEVIDRCVGAIGGWRRLSLCSSGSTSGASCRAGSARWDGLVRRTVVSACCDGSSGWAGSAWRAWLFGRTASAYCDGSSARAGSAWRGGLFGRTASAYYDGAATIAIVGWGAPGRTVADWWGRTTPFAGTGEVSFGGGVAGAGEDVDVVTLLSVWHGDVEGPLVVRMHGRWVVSSVGGEQQIVENMDKEVSICTVAG